MKFFAGGLKSGVLINITEIQSVWQGLKSVHKIRNDWAKDLGVFRQYFVHIELRHLIDYIITSGVVPCHDELRKC